MPRFALESPDGERLGTIALGPPDWPDGSTIYRGAEPNLRVVGRRDAGEQGLPVLVVEEV